MCLEALFGGGNDSPAPTQATVDPAAERIKAEQEAATKANETLLADARRKRQQKGVLATTDENGGSVLASGGAAPAAAASTVLGSGRGG